MSGDIARERAIGRAGAKVGDTATDWREVIDDSRVSVLPVKDEWCTGRGIPRLTAMVLQVGVIFESNNFCCPFVTTTAAAQGVGRSVHRAHRAMERRNFSCYAVASLMKLLTLHVTQVTLD